MSGVRKAVGITITDTIRKHLDLVRGHDAVHPDRNACGGVGGCKLLKAEVDSRYEIEDLLERCAEQGYELTVTVKGGDHR